MSSESPNAAPPTDAPALAEASAPTPEQLAKKLAADKGAAQFYSCLAVLPWAMIACVLLIGVPYFITPFKQMGMVLPKYSLIVLGLATAPASYLVVVLCGLAAIFPFLKGDKRLALGGLLLSAVLLLYVSAALCIPVWQRERMLETTGQPADPPLPPPPSPVTPRVLPADR